MPTADQLLYLLKTRGAQTAQVLATHIGLTSMGVRRQLTTLTDKGLVQFEDRRDGVGRPARYWSLTDAGHGRFPDRHGELTVKLIELVRSNFGDAALDQLVNARESEMEARYLTRLNRLDTLAARVSALAALRSEEGYLAHVQPQIDGSWLLIEEHCPICSAARACQGFCRSELQLFRHCLGDGVRVERVDHLLSGDHRCAYRIAPPH